MEHQQSLNKKFQDSSIDCAICLEPLASSNCVTLSCGHKWHLNCLKEQLEHAQPNYTHRLLFTGCRCAKCEQFCDHEQLQHLTRTVDILREKVDRLVEEQWQIEAPQLWDKRAAAANSKEKERLLEQGRQKFAFYLCKSCDEPYFGGTIECADNLLEEAHGSSSGLCPSCAPQSQLCCRHPLQHRGYHVWKCRYCCNPSQYVCYGTVHFCKSCHDRNSQRVQQQQQEQGSTAKPPPLDGIPCCPDTCPFPKPKDQDHHLNGPEVSCEQVYYCAVCESSSVIPQEAPGSQNFIQNPSGQLGLQGWQSMSRGRFSWKVETSEIPASEHSTTNFVSSYQWCVMGQRISLVELVRDPSSVQIEVSAKFMGRTDCPSVFMMEAIVLNRQQQPIQRAQTGPMNAPVDFWETARLVVGPIPGAHEVIMVIRGKDERFWQGDFGSKAANCSVRILGSQEELDTILLSSPANQQNPPPRRNRRGRIDYDALRNKWLDIFAPLILLLFLLLLSFRDERLSA
mmetsp:Transcript_2940/g.4423  ORF Transcript_2940/g.4423 Transcript_2940/m.4423 type:complete len:511 (+) Transcript_2940:79-1611(+)